MLRHTCRALVALAVGASLALLGAPDGIGFGSVAGAAKKGEKKAAKGDAQAKGMMEAWQKAGALGPQHALLKKLAGNWTVQSKAWMKPGEKAQESKGTSKAESIFGGRFVRSTYAGTFAGQPFSGEGLMGYNNMSKKFESTWIDSMSTATMFSEGTADKAGKVITFSGDYVCPMTGKNKTSKMVMRLIDNNKHVVEMYDRDPQGKEFKTMELVYTRAS